MMIPPTFGDSNKKQRKFKIDHVTGKDFWALLLLPRPLRASYFGRRVLKTFNTAPGEPGEIVFQLPNGEVYEILDAQGNVRPWLKASQ